ncbi:hypothetical protein [Ramlibacter algicola]|uniref:Uncharacterized protein n=1 Tax=Ramlibacter algicola TaxID=2795217 RepID=A0A934Q1G4_9BURK|nr:hypothetical protein [Ramlibacter algicola]MBK0393360.1 hypothetical protein [Ramlibacter algicola]
MTALHLHTPSTVPAAAFGPRPSLAERVVLRHLRSPAEIASVLHLRDEIDLSVHTAAGRQQFETLEKKETSAVSCSASNWTARRSGRSASCRWATGSR